MLMHVVLSTGLLFIATTLCVKFVFTKGQENCLYPKRLLVFFKNFCLVSTLSVCECVCVCVCVCACMDTQIFIFEFPY